MQHLYIKAEALGNEFVILDARITEISLTSEQAKHLADRQHGIGCDQVIVLRSPINPRADVKVEFFNSDGSLAEACGNGTRCVARFLMDESQQSSLRIETAQTLIEAFLEGGNDISLTMGKPRFGWREIPLVSEDALKQVVYKGQTLHCVNVGNPHVVFLVPDVQTIPLDQIGPEIETHAAFPDRVNVGFAQIINNHTIWLRVWERGAGFTKACGTGACAAAVVAIRQARVQSPVRVLQEGGELQIYWEEGKDIRMIGSAEIKRR